MSRAEHTHTDASAPPPQLRRDWMGLLARANPAELAGLLQNLPAHEDLRAPEIGTVMLRGRQGATGAAFNLGEMTVTRCALRLDCGTLGQAWVQGRDKLHARRAAVIDALMQTGAAQTTRAAILAPLAAAEADRHRIRAEKAAATRVEFFTLVRGEDQ